MNNPEVAQYVEAMKGRNTAVGAKAAFELGNIGDVSAVPALIQALLDSNDTLRSNAAGALGKIGDASAVPALIQALKDRIASVRVSAVVALERIGDDSATPALNDMLQDEHPSVRSYATRALEQISIPVLIQTLKNEHPSVRATAVETLGMIRSRSAVPALIERLNDEDAAVRVTAVEALERIGSMSAVPALVERLSDQHSSVRSNAAGALGKIGDASAVPALIQALQDRVASVRVSAVEALGRIGGASAVSALIERLNDEDAAVRVRAIKALERIGGAFAVPALIERLKNEHPSIRVTAVEALGRIGGAAAVPVLIERLNDEDAAIRVRAVEALERIGSVVVALERIGGASAVPALIRALNGKSSFTDVLEKIDVPATDALIQNLETLRTVIQGQRASGLSTVPAIRPADSAVINLKRASGLSTVPAIRPADSAVINLNRRGVEPDLVYDQHDMPERHAPIYSPTDGGGDDPPHLGQADDPTTFIAPSKIDRYTRVLFPSTCYLDKRINLGIQLTLQPSTDSRVVKKLTLESPPHRTEIQLDIHITAPGFALQQWHKQLIVPTIGASETLEFTLFPTELGSQVVEIEFIHEGSRIGYILVGTLVQEQPYTLVGTIKDSTAAQAVAQTINILEDPSMRLDGHSVSSTIIHRMLHVSAMEPHGNFSYTIYTPDLQDTKEWKQQVNVTGPEITQHLNNLNVFVQEVVTFDNPSDDQWESICSNLQGIGENLITTLIPAEVIDKIREWEQDSVLVISTDEQWIPWELMHDGDNFWGTKFRLVRCARTNDRREVPREFRPDVSTKDRYGVVNAVGGGIKTKFSDYEVRAAQLFSSFSLIPPPMVLEQKPFAALRKALVGAHLLHLTCHGHLEPHMLQIYSDKQLSQNLLPTTIKQLHIEPGCLVFANACSSDVPTLNLGKMQGFGWEFYRQGADAFVGTLGTIPTEQAINFAEAVYKELFRTDKKITLAEAIATAKQAAQGERNLFWLLYCIYGNPDFTLSLPS